ncbi:MAG: ComEC/Rec2 family competence protein [Eubacterium sp.]
MSRSKSTKAVPRIISVAVVIIFAVIFAVSGFNGDKTATKPAAAQNGGEGWLSVHYLDVGQGDSEFVQLPNGECMLIDAGDMNYGGEITEQIKSLGYDKIDYLIATHPHADHIGGMSEVIESFEIGEIYMPRAIANTATFEELLNTISDKGLSISTARSETVIEESGGLTMEFLSPCSAEYDDLNNYSAVLKITYNDSSFIFTGDAEDASENEMLENSYSKLNADVLKVGHHGSKYSTTEDFLDAVSPEYAVISCGKDNSYGHPHSETVKRLTDAGVKLYRTDRLGAVTISTSGDGSYDVDY